MQLLGLGECDLLQQYRDQAARRIVGFVCAPLCGKQPTILRTTGLTASVQHSDGMATAPGSMNRK
jgi:hypothetical protein